MQIKKIALLTVFFISFKSNPQEIAKINFTANVLINNPVLHNNNIDQINETLIFVTKDMKGVFSEDKLIRKNLKSYRLNYKESGVFLRSLNLLISDKYSCSAVTDESVSFHVILVGKFKNILGQFQITKPIGCPDKGFLITPGAVKELESWKSFESLLECYLSQKCATSDTRSN